MILFWVIEKVNFEIEKNSYIFNFLFWPQLTYNNIVYIYKFLLTLKGNS